jgi:predicted GIY-YIG superfamily endonuclease
MMKITRINDIYIYVLRLEEGKYYVGQSTDPERRFQEHLAGIKGSEWTKKYPPIEILKRVNTKLKDPWEALKLENRATIARVKEYGWQNVRGGEFTSLNDFEHLTSLIKHSGLGNELCPIAIKGGIDISKYKDCVYVLELEGGHYYVNVSGKLNLSICNEVYGNGSFWTRRYRPVKLIRVVAPSEEIKYKTFYRRELIRAFLEYHYSNVRGRGFNDVCPVIHMKKAYQKFGLRKMIGK